MQGKNLIRNGDIGEMELHTFYCNGVLAKKVLIYFFGHGKKGECRNYRGLC